MSVEKEGNKAKEFIREHWRELAVGTAGVTAVGVAVWLLSRYLRQKRTRTREEIAEFDIVEASVGAGIADSPLLIESGEHLAQVVGEEAVSAAEELAGQVPDFRVGEALEAMSEVAKKRKRLRK